MFSFSRDRFAAEIGPAAELWQDRDIRFDCDPKLLTFRPGEVAVERLEPVEDTKGNNGEKGILIVTNLRLIWQASSNPRTNLSIGLNAVQTVTTKTTLSKLRGNNTQALFIMSSFNGSRFEFIFTSGAMDGPSGPSKLFQTVQQIFASYEATTMYRDLKLRAAIVEDKKLIQLPGERVFRKTEGVWNLSSDQGNLGVFFLTSLRVVWFALLSENFNVSVPWVQMKEVYTRESKFGRALVIEASERSGGFLLGFRIDPPDALDEVAREMTALHSAGRLNPNFGVDFDRAAVERAMLEDEEEDDDEAGGKGAGATGGAKEGKEADGKAPDAKKKRKKKAKAGVLVTDDVEIVEASASDHASAVFAAYLGEGSKLSDRSVVFSHELGLAIEQPPEGLTIDKLWSPL